METCPECGAELHLFQEKKVCPQCVRFTMTIEVDLLDLVNLRENVHFKLVEPPKPRWIASLGCWEDIATPYKLGEKNPNNLDYKHFAPPIGPFNTKQEALEWVKNHSMALGNEEEHSENECGCGETGPHTLPDEKYMEYVMRLDDPSELLMMHLGDEPGQLSPEVASDILGDMIRRHQEEE